MLNNDRCPLFLHQYHYQIVVRIIKAHTAACQLTERLNGIQCFQHTALHFHIGTCHHGTDNLRKDMATGFASSTLNEPLMILHPAVPCRVFLQY